MQSVPTNMYGGSAMPPNGQHSYPASSYGYSSYYNAVPPPPPPPAPVPGSTADQSQSIGNVPWATNPPVPPPASSAEKTAYGADAEYEKFMAEMK
ncbi:branchpoint-bridging protein [Prunus yedoensis var. nudiflora]|nr:branchpoint-bridging protein [Prunus yedoensis var. nudiflora]